MLCKLGLRCTAWSCTFSQCLVALCFALQSLHCPLLCTACCCSTLALPPLHCCLILDLPAAFGCILHFQSSTTMGGSTSMYMYVQIRDSTSHRYCNEVQGYPRSPNFMVKIAIKFQTPAKTPRPAMQT